MAWIAALIGAVGAGGLAAAGGQAQEKAGDKGLAANLGAYKKAKQMVAPYQQVGEAGLLSLGELMGLKGYRTQQEVDLNKYLKTAPKAPNASGYVPKGYEDAFNQYVLSAPIAPMTMGTALGAGLEFNPLRPIPGASALFGGIGGGLTGDAEKDEAIAKMMAMRQAKARYERDLATYNTTTMPEWEKKRALLQMESNQSLADYDPMKVLQATPGYQARYNQGQEAVQAQQVGRQLSGRAAQELQNAGQQFASGEYGNEIARRSNVAGIGQQAANQLGNWAVGQGNSLANMFQQQGANTANTYANYNNVLQGSLGNYLTAQNQQKDRDLYRSIYG